MNSFALHLEKIAQAGTMMRPSPAQLYASERAQKDFDSLMQAGSPKAYSTAIAGGILSGLGLPTILGLTSLGGGKLIEKTNKKKAGTYISEALTRVYNFPDDEARMIASSMVSTNPKVTANVNARIAEARIGLADMLAQGPLTGVVDAQSRRNILNRAEQFVDAALSDAVNQPLRYQKFTSLSDRIAAEQRAVQDLDRIKSSSLPKKIKLVGTLPEAKAILTNSSEFKRTLIPGFTPSETKALMGIGEKLYTQRTGKALSDTRVAISLVSKQIGNSIKAGIPLAAILGGVAAFKERSRAKEKARVSDVSPVTAFGGLP